MIELTWDEVMTILDEAAKKTGVVAPEVKAQAAAGVIVIVRAMQASRVRSAPLRM